MRIENELKLDFKDVLFKPKRSTLKSRKDVDLTRSIKFPHSEQVWSGIPIAAANMDTVATIEAGKVLTQMKMMVCLHKHYTEDEYTDLYGWVYANQGAEYASIGHILWVSLMRSLTSSIAFKLGRVGRSTIYRLANGYTERFIDFVSRVRKAIPKAVIIAGNVVTAEVTSNYLSGC